MKPTSLSWRDLLAEAVAGLASRPGRTVLTILGTVLGVSALVATVGTAQTAGNQIVGAFSELEATSIVVTNSARGTFGEVSQIAIPRDAEDRLVRLNGVNAAGTLGEVNIGPALVSSVIIDDPLSRNEFQIDVVAASPGLYDAVRGELRTGRWFDIGHDERADNVAVLGAGAAETLGIYRVDQQPVIFIGEDPFVVIGILDNLSRQNTLLGDIIIPDGTARDMYAFESAEKVQIDVAIGASDLIAEQGAIALMPESPERLTVQRAPSPTSLRNKVQSDVNSLFLVLGGISLLVGAIGIANVTLVSVLERIGEIGLRRAMGATRRHIATQFLVESTAMGLIGGIIGASVGVLVIVIMSAVREWTPVIDPLIPFGAPVLGALTGLLAGVYPSLRASALEPVDALRSGT